MSDPWLTVIGIGEDSLEGLPPASQAALRQATCIIGGPRHLALVGAGERGLPWPVPFSIEPVLARRGTQTVVLASGDPFWFGAGGSLTAKLDPTEWRALPAPSTFSLVAASLGWRLETVSCRGLHAAPFARLRSDLAPGGRIICLVRDGGAPKALADWLVSEGAGLTDMTVCEKLGGPDARIRRTVANSFDLESIEAPVAVALELPERVGLSRASGLPDDVFAHHGQITKRPIRALTLSALGPQPGAHLWDLGAGSGSISVEWCLAGGHATAIERRADRAELITQNANAFGVEHRLSLQIGDISTALPDLPQPDAVFVGGGGTATLFVQLFEILPAGVRIVANGVTLETESLLTRLHAEHGGELMRIAISHAQPLGSYRGWEPARPLVQWSVVT